MSFLFGWTKYFHTNKSTTTSTNTNNTQPSQNSNNEITTQTDEKYDEKYNQSSSPEPAPQSEADTSSDSESLLSGSFETLEEEIAYLRSQNTKLKQRITYHKSQAKLFKSSLTKPGVLQMKVNGKLVNIKQPQLCQLSLDELSQKVEERLPKFLSISKTKSTSIIPSSNANEIGIIDLESVDWGDMVKYDTISKSDAMKTFENNENTMQIFEETELNLNGPFIVLSEEDVIDAIAYFVAQCVMNIPECHNLDHEEMIKMINGTFLELKSKGPLGKMLDWGTFVYRSFGWGTTAYTVYTNAAMAKTVLSCLVSAAFFIGVL